MKMIKLIETWLDEMPIKQQADVLGLEYAGYGRWKEKSTGKIVAKTSAGRLISIKGTGDNSMDAPADYPNEMTPEPIGGDSVDGSDTIETKNDAYMDYKLPVSHMQMAHTAY